MFYFILRNHRGKINDTASVDSIITHFSKNLKPLKLCVFYFKNENI